MVKKYVNFGEDYSINTKKRSAQKWMKGHLPCCWNVLRSTDPAFCASDNVAGT